MVITRFGTLLFLLLCGTPVLANDPHPPQLAVSFLTDPAPIVQYGSMRLLYEMLITNFSKSSYILDSVKARAGDTQSKCNSATLAAMIVHLGAPTAPDSSDNRTIDGGRIVIVFFMLDLGNSKVPSEIEIGHLLHVLDDHSERHDLSPTPLPI